MSTFPQMLRKRNNLSSTMNTQGNKVVQRENKTSLKINLETVI